VWANIHKIEVCTFLKVISKMSTVETKQRLKLAQVSKGEHYFKILGVDNAFTIDDPPPPFVKDQVVKLISGKYPLHDYKDTSNYAKHTYIFELSDTDGKQFSCTLDGFSYDCTHDGMVYDLGSPYIYVTLN
jgi:hypothetical protein